MLYFHKVERKLVEVTDILSSWKIWEATSSGDKTSLGEHFCYDKSVFSNLTCSPHVQTRSKGQKSFAYSVTGWRCMWLHGWNSEIWRSGSEIWHLIALRYSAFQLWGTSRRALGIIPARHVKLVLIPWAAEIALDIYFLAAESTSLFPVSMSISPCYGQALCWMGSVGRKDTEEARKGCPTICFFPKHLLWWSGRRCPNQPPERRQSHLLSLMGILAQLPQSKCGVALPTPTWERSKWNYYSVFSLIDKSEVRCVVFFKRPNELVARKNHVRTATYKMLCQVIFTYETKSITRAKATFLCAKVCCMQKG